MKRCRYCGREILWMNRKAGRAVAVDPEPVFVIEGDGRERFLREEEEDLVGRAARDGEIQNGIQKMNTPVGFVPHWRTCGKKRGAEKWG